MMDFGINCAISKNAQIGANVHLGHNCIVEDDAQIGDNVYIDSNTIVRGGVVIGNDSFIGANCIIGEYLADFPKTRIKHIHPLMIGVHALIRSGTIIYGDNQIGDYFQTGHRVTIREKSLIGDHVSIGTLSDIQGNCRIGNYVNLHSNVHVGQLSVIDDCVWIFPYVVLTNDPTPPSNDLEGVHIHSFAIIATSATILPGVEIMGDSLVAAGATVTKNVNRFEVVGGCPGKVISDVRNINNKITGKPAYPWRFHFDRRMPWEESGYEAWYNSLSIEDKNKLGLD